MSIHSTGKVYGAAWTMSGDDGVAIKQFEQTYPTELSRENLHGILGEYAQITPIDLPRMRFRYYTSYTYSPEKSGEASIDPVPETDEIMTWFFCDRETMENILNA